MRVREARRRVEEHLRGLFAFEGEAPAFVLARLRLRTADALASLEVGAGRLDVQLLARRPGGDPRRGRATRHFLVVRPPGTGRPDPLASAFALLAERLAARDRGTLGEALATAFADEPGLPVVLPGTCGQACRFCRDPQAETRTLLDRLRGALARPRDGAEAYDAAHRLLDDARATHRRVLFRGEDALACEALPILVAAACALGYEGVGVLTPGARLGDGDLLERLVAAGLDSVEVPLYGHDALRHDGVTRCPGSFARLVAGVRRARAAGVHVIAHTVLVDATLPHLAAIAALCDELDVSLERLEGLAADAADPARHAAYVPTLGAVRAALAAAAPGLPRPIALVDLPDCVLAPPLAGFVVRPRPVGAGPRVPDVHAGPCAACARRARCPGVPRTYLTAHGDDDLVTLPG